MSGILLRSARLVGRADRPRDVLIRDGVVVALAASGGTDAAALATAGPDGRRPEPMDLDGRRLIPGLWDHHVHFSQWALVRRRVDVSAAASAAHARALVEGHLADAPEPEGSIVIGYGFRDALWPDEPTDALLELGSTAVVLVSGDLHCVWINRAARQLLGGVEDAAVLREEPAFAVNTRLSRVSDELLDAWADEAARAAAARGVVGIVDLEMDDAPAQWMRRIGSGSRSLRVRAGVYPQHLDLAVERGLRTDVELPGTGGLGVVGPLKIITDGSLNTRTAYCHDPYPGLSGELAAGMSTVAPEELVALLRRGAAAGFAPTVHAIGDLANSLALDAFDEVGIRGSMEHAQLVDAVDFPRFGALGVVASVQPEHAMDDRDVADRHWSGRTDRAFALRSLAEAGARLALGSDAPVAPLDPWVTMAAAVFRSRDGRAPWHPEQRIGIEAALAASTGTGRATVAVGDVADLVVLDADPATADADAVRSMPVAATLLAGEWTHRLGV